MEDFNPDDGNPFVSMILQHTNRQLSAIKLEDNGTGKISAVIEIQKI
jgi:hypothetical protein